MPPRNRTDSTPSAGDRPSGKGRPTPKRREAEALRKRPLVPDRKEATRARRAADKARRDREYQAMLTGDERHLPARDKGPVRRWVRDYVDSRRNPGEYFLPIAIVFVFASFFAAASAAAYFALMILLYVSLIVMIVHAVLLARRLNRLAVEKFGADRVPPRIGLYGVMRSFQMRRTRLPKPQVERGQHRR